MRNSKRISVFLVLALLGCTLGINGAFAAEKACECDSLQNTITAKNTWGGFAKDVQQMAISSYSDPTRKNVVSVQINTTTTTYSLPAFLPYLQSQIQKLFEDSRIIKVEPEGFPGMAGSLSLYVVPDVTSSFQVIAMLFKTGSSAPIWAKAQFFSQSDFDMTGYERFAASYAADLDNNSVSLSIIGLNNASGFKEKDKYVDMTATNFSAKGGYNKDGGAYSANYNKTSIKGMVDQGVSSWYPIEQSCTIGGKVFPMKPKSEFIFAGKVPVGKVNITCSFKEGAYDGPNNYQSVGKLHKKSVNLNAVKGESYSISVYFTYTGAELDESQGQTDIAFKLTKGAANPAQ